MNELYEALKGLTDIPLAILSAICGILLFKIKLKHKSIFFFSISVTAVMGTVVHVFSFSKLTKNLIWLFLYLLFYESIRRFTLLFLSLLKGTTNKKFLFVCEIILYLITVVIMFTGLGFDMIILCVYSAICICILFAALLKCRPLPKKIIGFLMLPSAAAIFQALRSFIPYSAVIAHGILFTAILIFYFIVKENNTDRI
ncbi:MAG: hypothetical protein KBS52_07585 [Clostridiales bacterium]|nr:hypothetical protein [Candidatus Equinaster intestinalis]